MRITRPWTRRVFSTIPHRLFPPHPPSPRLLPPPAPATALSPLLPVLAALPPISTYAPTTKQGRIANLEIQRQLSQWRIACSLAHRTLSQPQSAYFAHLQRRYYANSVVRIVANTIRLLVRLGHYAAAKELDRAFFTSHRASAWIEQGPPSNGGTSNEQGYIRPNHYELGHGIALPRNHIRLAWMQSLSLRTEEGLYRNPGEEFSSLLHSFYSTSQSGRDGTRGVDPVTVAFLIRKLTQVQDMGEERGWTRQEGGFEKGQVERMLDLLRSSNPGQSSLVVRADLEAALQRQTNYPHLLHDDETERLRIGIQSLVQQLAQEESSLEEDELDFTQAQQIVQEMQSAKQYTSHSFAPRPPTLPRLLSSSSLLDKANTLHLASQFFILSAHRSDSTQQKFQFLRSAGSAYLAILRMLSDVGGSKKDGLLMGEIRERALSTLYRILWAAIGVYESERSDRLQQQMRKKSCDPLSIDGPTNYSAVEDSLKLLEETIRTFSSLPVPSTPSSSSLQPQLLLISSSYIRSLLLTLSLPSSPSRQSSTLLPPAPKTPWPLLRHTLLAIQSLRAHDVRIGIPQSMMKLGSKRRYIFKRRAIIIALVRATIISGDTIPIGGDIEAEEERIREVGSVESRLSFLLSWFDSFSSTCGEEIDKEYVEIAVGIVLAEEWKGTAWKVWKGDLREGVYRWRAGEGISFEREEEVGEHLQIVEEEGEGKLHRI